MKYYKNHNHPRIIDRIMCWLHWHVQDRKNDDAYLDGINRPHAWCKYCYSHLPLFGHKEVRFMFGHWRQRILCRDVSEKEKYFIYNR